MTGFLDIWPIIMLFTAACLLQIQETRGRFRIDPTCSPPRGDVCIEIRRCPYFVQLMDSTPIPRPRHVIATIRQHQCGFAGSNPKVCCFSTTDLMDSQNIQQAPDVTNHPNLHLLPKDDCGRAVNNFNLRITGGSKTAPMEFPWMALLVFYTGNQLEYRCGGTLINERYVLTAAHCIVNLTLVGVRLGEHNVNTQKDCDESTGFCAPPVQDFYPEEIIPHPNYNPATSEDDIALIRLATPANFTYENIQPICLPTADAADVDLDGKFAVVSGWGVTDNGFKSAELMVASVPVVPTRDCTRIYRNRRPLTYKQLCAGGYLGRDSCGGDSGGPLMFVRYGGGMPRYVQYGVVSYGPRYCGTNGQPGVYTNAAYYMDWILDNLKPSR